MFIDVRTLPDGSRLETDLAIIGGGVAGITLARALADSRAHICIIEAGGLEYDAEVQAFYDGECVGISYPLTGNRLRYFGGSSNHWGGFCRPLEAIDFEVRDWVPHSGWPFAIDELAPYYGPASEVVEIAPPRFGDKTYWARHTGTELPDLPSGRMEQRFVQFSPPTRFGTRYRDELRAAPNVDVLLNANVTLIAARTDGRSVQAVRIATLNGLHHEVHARQFVLATGGLENARMLLLSDDVMPAGLGNRHDLVGRYFMEHPHLSGFGDIVLADLERLPPIYRRRVRVEGRDASAAFTPSERFLRDNALLNAVFMAGEAGTYRDDTTADWPHARQHVDMLRAASHLIGRPHRPADAPLGNWLGLGCACEQAPNPDSRVMLTDERDRLGLRRIRLDWRLTHQDRHSVVTHMRMLAAEIGALGAGRMLVYAEHPDDWPAIVSGGAHHMGTTRMHDDPRQGVVDRNAKVHGVDNLYIAGSSVFPTSGAANPTLTIVALTLRLADHLRTRVT
ncbi:MAG: GMC family oxidoreductase [Gammaproteobacteria bacterium]|nr:GMC family oxidoreductase [Gammaproteobacteria bacterium]